MSLTLDMISYPKISEADRSLQCDTQRLGKDGRNGNGVFIRRSIHVRVTFVNNHIFSVRRKTNDL